MTCGKQYVVCFAGIERVGKCLALVVNFYIGIDFALVAVGDRGNVKIINTAVGGSECVVCHKVGAVHSDSLCVV